MEYDKGNLISQICPHDIFNICVKSGNGDKLASLKCILNTDMNNKLLEMQYFDCTGVWSINCRNGYSTFEFYVTLQYCSVYFNVF